jgi:hypothetical protein
VSVELFLPFVAKQLDCALQDVTPEHGTPMELVELLWPLLQMFSGGEDAAVALRQSTYDGSDEPEVDRFLEAWEADPHAENGVRSAGAARVLFERVQQAVIVCGANEAAGEMMMMPPRSLPPGVRQVAAALLMLHKMELPFYPGTATPRPSASPREGWR